MDADDWTHVPVGKACHAFEMSKNAITDFVSLYRISLYSITPKEHGICLDEDVLGTRYEPLCDELRAPDEEIVRDFGVAQQLFCRWLPEYLGARGEVSGSKISCVLFRFGTVALLHSIEDKDVRFRSFCQDQELLPHNYVCGIGIRPHVAQNERWWRQYMMDHPSSAESTSLERKALTILFREYPFHGRSNAISDTEALWKMRGDPRRRIGIVSVACACYCMNLAIPDQFSYANQNDIAEMGLYNFRKDFFEPRIVNTFSVCVP